MGWEIMSFVNGDIDAQVNIRFPWRICRDKLSGMGG